MAHVVPLVTTAFMSQLSPPRDASATNRETSDSAADGAALAKRARPARDGSIDLDSRPGIENRHLACLTQAASYQGRGLVTIDATGSVAVVATGPV